LYLLQQHFEKDKKSFKQIMQCRRSVAKISLVGVGLRSHAGVLSKVLTTLADEHIPVLLVSTSEIKISVLIDQRYMELGVRVLHSKFDLSV
jgi:aspartate kinase